MDSRTGLVRYDEPTKDAVTIPAHFGAQVQWCAEHGIPLHSAQNPHRELRRWAVSNMLSVAYGMSNSPAAAEARHARAMEASRQELSAVRPNTWGNYGTIAARTVAASNLRKEQIKRKRKLQKQRGVR